MLIYPALGLLLPTILLLGGCGNRLEQENNALQHALSQSKSENSRLKEELQTAQRQASSFRPLAYRITDASLNVTFELYSDTSADEQQADLPQVYLTAVLFGTSKQFRFAYRGRLAPATSTGDSRIISVTFVPEDPQSVLGIDIREFSSLESIQLGVRPVLQHLGFRLGGVQNVSLRLNGFTVIDESSPEVTIVDGRESLSLAARFQAIPASYDTAVRQRVPAD